MGTDNLYPMRQFRVFIGGHPGLALMGGKGSGLGLFVRKGSCPKDPRFVLSLTTMTVSLLFVFMVEDLKPGFSLYKQDVISAPVLEKLLFRSSPCPQRENTRSGETRSVLTRDQTPQ